ncbi:MAG: ABC transporter ATP-binding protein [Candidatus Omnitrophota bacterium]
MIKIENLSKQFGDFWAIKNLNLQVKKGEFYCLLGPNGAGKTTTLKIITGLMRPTEGKVFVDGLDVSAPGDYLSVKSILGFIPDTPFLYDNLTCVEFLEFVGDVFGILRKDLYEKIDYYFDLFKLGESRNNLIKGLSHGMRQKIVYISNFIHSPKVYLIDEPLVGLDPYSIHTLKKILKQETLEGKSILLCTHILSIAEELADCAGIIYGGKLIAEGSPHELRTQLSANSLEEAFLKLTA